MFRIDTERLFIRPWTDDDRPAFKALTDNPLVMEHVHRGEPYNASEIDEWFSRQARHMATYGFCMGALVEKASGEVIGVAGTQPLGDDLEIGWWLASDRWGRGYATEAGAAAMDYVLNHLQRPRAIAIIHPTNEPSKRVAARLGMQYEGRFTGEQLRHRLPQLLVDVYSRNRE